MGKAHHKKVQDFKLPDQNFNQPIKYTMIEQLDNGNIDEDLATLRLNKLEEFWIQKLKTLHLYDFNAEFNFPNQ